MKPGGVRGALWQEAQARARLPASKRYRYGKSWLRFRFSCFPSSHPVAFSPAVLLLSRVAVTPFHPAPPLHRAVEMRALAEHAAWGCSRQGLGRPVGWGGCPVKSSALLCSERRIEQLCFNGHFALKKIDLSFRCVVSIEAGLNLLSEDDEAT